jgi:hypothetical protein
MDLSGKKKVFYFINLPPWNFIFFINFLFYFLENTGIIEKNGIFDTH